MHEHNKTRHLSLFESCYIRLLQIVVLMRALQLSQLALQGVRGVVSGHELAAVPGEVPDVEHADIHDGHVEEEDLDVQLQLSAAGVADARRGHATRGRERPAGR